MNTDKPSLLEKIKSENAPARSLLVLGETTYRNHKKRFGMLPMDRTRHTYVLGKTGTGKSTLLANMVIQDIQNGRGLALLDPHGDLVEQVLPLIPGSRINDVLLFSPSDRDWPISFNIFRQGKHSHSDLDKMAEEILSVFKRQWGEISWGPRLEHILMNSMMAIAPDSRASLIFLYKFLTDENLRKSVIKKIDNPVVKQYWTKEFPSYGNVLQGEAMAPVLNKLGGFINNPKIRNIIGQERSRVDLVDLIQNRGILLANLSTSSIGENSSRLLGGLLLTAVQLAAASRPKGGPSYITYIDEFQNFANNESLATVLAESRKHGLGLVLAHQYMGQLPENTRSAVFGNVGTQIVFGIGGSDAGILEPEFFPPFSARDLEQMPNYHMAVKLLIRGEYTNPFSARSLPPPSAPEGSDIVKEQIIEQSRSRFCQKKDRVERHIARLFYIKEEPQTKCSSKSDSSKKDKEEQPKP